MLPAAWDRIDFVILSQAANNLTFLGIINKGEHDPF